MKGTKEVSEDLKQRIMGTAKKTDRYDARIMQFRQNQQFSTNQQRFYQSLTETTDNLTDILTKMMSHNSGGIYGTPQKSTTHNGNKTHRKN